MNKSPANTWGNLVEEAYQSARILAERLAEASKLPYIHAFRENLETGAREPLSIDEFVSMERVRTNQLEADFTSCLIRFERMSKLLAFVRAELPGIRRPQYAFQAPPWGAIEREEKFFRTAFDLLADAYKEVGSWRWGVPERLKLVLVASRKTERSPDDDMQIEAWESFKGTPYPSHFEEIVTERCEIEWAFLIGKLADGVEQFLPDPPDIQIDWEKLDRETPTLERIGDFVRQDENTENNFGRSIPQLSELRKARGGGKLNHDKTLGVDGAGQVYRKKSPHSRTIYYLRETINKPQ